MKLSVSLLFLFAMSFSMIASPETSFLPAEDKELAIEKDLALEKVVKSNSETNLEAVQTKTISWDSFQDTFEESYTDTFSSWEFGPTPSFSLTYANGTPIGLADTIQTGPTNEWVVDIEIPIEALAGENFGLAGFSLAYRTPDNLYELSSVYGYSNIDLDIPEQQISINQGWFSLGIEINSSDPNPTPPPPEDVFLFNNALRSFNFDAASNSWNFHLVGHLIDSILEGRWMFSLFVVDESMNSVSFGYRAYSSPNPPYREFFIGVPSDYEFGGFDGYKVALTDSNGVSIDSPTRGVPFLMNFTVSSAQSFDFALIELELPFRYQKLINTTEYYQNVTTLNSGWMYNETLQSYQWYDGITGELVEEVYGSHETLTEVYADRYVDLDGFIYEEKLLLFAYSNGSVFPKIGTLYNDRQDLYVRDISADIADNLVVFNNGNYDDSIANRYTITFNLTVDPAVPSGEYLWFNSIVMNGIGNELYQTSGSYLYQIGIETRVAKTRLFTSEGEVTQDTLNVKEDESFRVSSVLQGVTGDTDIQAVSLVLNGYEYKYNETSYVWSQVEVFARYDYKKGEIEVGAYNSTQREVLFTGEYQDWVYTEKTGFHWEYNTTSGDYDWVDGTYYEWEYATVYGDYWQYQYYDQEAATLGSCAGESCWFEGWIPFYSPTNLIGDNNSNLLNITAHSVVISDGMLTFDLNLTITPLTPNLFYDFQVRFETFGFQEDYEADYGPQVSTIWLREPVPSINVNGEDIFVNIVDYPLYLEYNNQKYLINEEPYIQIDTTFEFIRTFVEYDFYDQTEREFLVNERWNPNTGDSELYYTLLNGTKIFIEEGIGAGVFTLQFNTTGDLAYLNNTQIDTFQRYAFWEGDYYNGTAWINQYSFFLIDGSTLLIDTDQEIQSDIWYHPITSEEIYNTTLFFLVNSTNFLAENPQNYLNLHQYVNGVVERVSQLEVQDNWPQWDWNTGFYFVIDAVTGERYYFYENATWDYFEIYLHPEQYPCDYYCVNAEYLIDIGGTTYVVGEGPWSIEQVYTTTQLGLGTFDIPQRFIQQIYFVKDSPNLLLPTIILPARSYWDLQNTITNGGLVPTLKSVKINGEKWLLRRLGNDNWELEFPSNGTTIPILPGSVNIDRFVLVINGQNYWNSSQTGYSIQYGKASAVDEQIVDVHGSFNAKTYNFEGSFYPSTLYKDTYFVLNSTDGSRIEIQDRPLGRIFEMTFNSSTTPVNANTTYDFYNYYDWNGTHSFYTYISLTGENLTSVDVDASVSVFYDYLAIFNNALGEWQFNYDGAVVSYNTWISDWSFYITWDQFVTIDSVDYIITDQIWISGDEYNFTYGFLSGWSYVDVGWFIALTDFGTYFYEWYEYLLNQTTMEEIRVNSTEVRVLWKVLLNGSLLVYTANSWLYDDWDTYYEVESYNGSYYQFFTLDDFEYLDEIHVYPENGLYNFSGDDLDFFSYYSFGTYLAEIDGQIVELESNEYWTPIITVFYQGQDRTLSFREEPILRRISHYGYPFREMYVWDWSIIQEVTCGDSMLILLILIMVHWTSMVISLLPQINTM
jgi:hypothetical protein